MRYLKSHSSRTIHCDVVKVKISEIKTISIMGFIFMILSIGVLGCDQFAGTSVPITSTSPRIDTQTSQNTEYPIPAPLTSDFPTNTKWVIKGTTPATAWAPSSTCPSGRRAPVPYLRIYNSQAKDWTIRGFIITGQGIMMQPYAGSSARI